MKTSLRAVDNDHEHSRDYARRKVKEWRSNAERERLPVSNPHDDKGAKVLDVDSTLKWEPKHIGRK